MGQSNEKGRENVNCKKKQRGKSVFEQGLQVGEQTEEVKRLAESMVCVLAEPDHLMLTRMYQPYSIVFRMIGPS